MTPPQMCLEFKLINTPMVKTLLIQSIPLTEEGERSILELTLIKMELNMLSFSIYDSYPNFTY